MSRRFRGFIASGSSIAMMMREGSRSILVGQAIPASAEFYTAYFCHERNAFICVFEDESFGMVGNGCLIPIAEGPVIEEIDPNDEPAGWRTELADMISEGHEVAKGVFAIKSQSIGDVISVGDGRYGFVPEEPPKQCSCHERDSSYVCEYCYAKGFRGHMQKGL